MKKRSDRFVLVVVVITFVVLTAGAVGAADLQIEEAAVCTDVVDRQPVDSAASFPATVGKLYFFTRIVGAQDPVNIEHAWYFGDVERARVTLAVNGSNWRTFSSKVIQEHEIGAWRVEVLDSDGNTLETVQFEVTQ